MLNRLADAEAPGRRAEGRQLRLALWARLRRLLALRLVWRHGRKAVAIRPPPPRPAPPRRARSSQRTRRQTPRATVRASLGADAVSTGVCQNHQPERDCPQVVGNELASQRISTVSARSSDQQIETAVNLNEAAEEAHESSFPTCTDRMKNERLVESLENQLAGSSGAFTAVQQTAPPFTSSQISEAARALAKLPRRPRRKWTGWLTGAWRGYRDQPVLLPGGKPAYLFGALRGRAVITLDRGCLLGGYFGDGPIRWAVLPVSAIRPLKNPHAVVLGGRKLGIRERPSLAKQMACRINGCRPCHTGKRRGRPRRY